MVDMNKITWVIIIALMLSGCAKKTEVKIEACQLKEPVVLIDEEGYNYQLEVGDLLAIEDTVMIETIPARDAEYYYQVSYGLVIGYVPVSACRVIVVKESK